MKSVYVDSKRKSIANLQIKYPNTTIIDVTSKGVDPFVKLSPFYPHGDIPIPFSGAAKAMSVEGIWQGLKVFDGADVNTASFENKTMKDIKRTVRKYGPPLGHRKGINGNDLLSYMDARRVIYLPSYLWVLQNKVTDVINQIREEGSLKDIVLLDYETNEDVNNLRKPLSHAYLVKQFLLGTYPE
ncbi:MAG: hypothetical protein DI538_10990 [Azospira oryzae]|nr:MAG: hypothetical protein DI538_10990 [Azospira oryzae]